MKRIISILLSALMVIAIIPVSVFMVSAEGETVELYHNDFETAMNPAGGTQSSCERQDYETYGKAMTVWGKGRWDEPVKLNNATGAITIVMHAYTNNFVNQTTLGINGVQVVHCGGDSQLKIGTVKNGAVKQWKKLIITVEIPDLSTGTANVTVANADGSYPTTGTAELGAISDTLNLYVVAGNHSMKVMDVKVSQVAAEVPEAPEVPMETLCEVGYTEFASWATGTYVEQTVTTNGTDGDIVIVFTPERNNWNSSGNNLLSVNGVSLITTGGEGGYNLGSTNVAANHVARAITVTIDVATGDATIVDTAGNSGTANVGAIGDKFTLKINQDSNNGWELTSLVAKQIVGDKRDTQSRENYNYYKNEFDGGKAKTDGTYFNSDVVGEGGILTVDPANSKDSNRFKLAGSIANTVMSFKFKVPKFPENNGGTITALFGRSSSKAYLKMGWVSPEGVDPYFVAYSGVVGTEFFAIKEDTWYTMTILFPDDSTKQAIVFINTSYIASIDATDLAYDSGYGFNFLPNADGAWAESENLNAATYCIDDFAVSSVADESFVKITGFQKTDVDDGTYNVRFVAAIEDLFQGEKAIGFEIVATYGDGESKTWNDPVKNQTTTVYESISAEYGTETVTAESIGGKYITAMAITGIPSNVGTVTFTVKPYVVINGTRYYGSTVTVTVHPAA